MVRLPPCGLALRLNGHTGARLAPCIRMNELSPPVSELDHHRGSLDAPVVLVEFGDYECPHCAAVHPVIQQLQAEAGAELCFVYRHFPLVEIHRLAQTAAEAAEAAGGQGRFWDLHDKLYENSPALDLPQLIQYAREIGLEVNRFRDEVRTHVYLPRVQIGIESGLETGVHGTPTFFINGVQYRGSYDLETMLQALKVAR
jgi:protein-disulfide isomerase